MVKFFATIIDLESWQNLAGQPELIPPLRLAGWFLIGRGESVSKGKTNSLMSVDDGSVEEWNERMSLGHQHTNLSAASDDSLSALFSHFINDTEIFDL